MLNRIKTLCVLTVSLAVATASFGATVTVRKDGTGNFLTLDAALESLNYQDGNSDLILVGPGEYDGQVTVNANAGANSTRYPNAFNMTPALVQSAYQTHQDPLTIRGENPNDPAVIYYVNGTDRAAQPYGMFPNDPGDFFFASVVMCGNNCTFENIEFRHGVIDYCINGMAAGIVFNDCLFTNGITGGVDDFWDFNNNIEITSYVDPSIAADNEYSFNNCLWDGLNKVDGTTFFDSTWCYFHGYDAIAKPANDPAIYGGTSFSGCVFTNWDANIHQPRGREEYYRGLAGHSAEDCYAHNVRQVFAIQGSVGSWLVNRNVFNFSAAATPIVETRRVLEINERSQGQARELVVSNNLFIGGGQTAGYPLIRASVGSTANIVAQLTDWRFVNNTFAGYDNDAIRIEGNVGGSAGSQADVVVANNIFSGNGGASIAVNYTATGANAVALVNNGYNNNGTDVTGAPATNTGGITGNPNFDNAVVTQPATPGASQVQGFNPTNAAYLNSGDQAAYNAIAGVAGNLDVDQTHTTANIDRGAQQNEPISVLDWSIY